MGQIMVPVIGLVFWLAHMARQLSGRPLDWLFWAWIAGLPAAAGFCFFYFIRLPGPIPASEINAQNFLSFSPEQIFWLTNAAYGLAEWIIFLVVEPILLYASDLVRRRLDRTAPPHRPE
ncbi:hypothetical protein MXD63_14040 [Frankia sp. Cpl3]|nr:hypothetical protein [Frankia sp. Cpl3]